MIDKTGNKINTDKEKFDLDFALKELNFLLKCFHKRPETSVAMTTASLIRKILPEISTRSSSYQMILDAIHKLEQFCAHSLSENYVWEIVLILRTLARNEVNASKYASGGKLYQRCASLFDRICEIKPSLHNQCCRVLEKCVAAECFQKKRDNYYNNHINAYNILIKAEAEFKNITQQSPLYFETGECLYRNLVVVSERMKCYSHKSFYFICEAVNYAEKYFETNENGESLLTYLTDYERYTKYKEFPAQQEKQRFESIIALTEKWLLNNTSSFVKSSLSALKKIYNSFYPN